ncbi:hypothetical protein [Actinophytocola oryzae]|uniref:Uncharacterized protein n=1 Tax=Actinophytocola oryzae TaxID=502181 RepID=A0A4R7VHF7_9PSEU|nr:hypothetical protein [Actinophytocola oryzae]TDV48762.1 hypothetical protein CLV71_108122 [Actinophytocola oryzae]
MAELSSSQRPLRGALVGFDPRNPLAGLVVFQYNPDELSRSLSPRTMPGGEDDANSPIVGAPVEVISLTAEIDAADRTGPLSAGDVHGPLAALEMLLYPRTSAVLANEALAAAGTIELLPVDPPLTLLVWGVTRVLPVRLTAFTVTEQAFDAALNPVRAQVQLSLRVLSYSDLPVTDAGHHIFLAHQVAKEALATRSAVAGVAAPVIAAAMRAVPS